MKRSPVKRSRSKPRPGRLKGAGLEALRNACFLRDRGICTNCGEMVQPHAPHIAATSYHMAHIKAKRISGDTLENVRTLCGTCHRREHEWGKSGTKPIPPKDVAPATLGKVATELEAQEETGAN